MTSRWICDVPSPISISRYREIARSSADGTLLLGEFKIHGALPENGRNKARYYFPVYR